MISKVTSKITRILPFTIIKNENSPKETKFNVVMSVIPKHVCRMKIDVELKIKPVVLNNKMQWREDNPDDLEEEKIRENECEWKRIAGKSEQKYRKMVVVKRYDRERQWWWQ